MRQAKREKHKRIRLCSHLSGATAFNGPDRAIKSSKSTPDAGDARSIALHATLSLPLLPIQLCAGVVGVGSWGGAAKSCYMRQRAVRDRELRFWRYMVGCCPRRHSGIMISTSRVLAMKNQCSCSSDRVGVGAHSESVPRGWERINEHVCHPLPLRAHQKRAS